MTIFFFFSLTGADLQAASDDEVGQVSLRHHLGDRAGAPRPGQVPQRRRGPRERPQDRHVQSQAQRLSVFRALLGILGAQQSGQGG